MSENATINIRLPIEVIEKLDGIARAETVRTGFTVTRSDIVRRALVQAVEQEATK